MKEKFNAMWFAIGFSFIYLMVYMVSIMFYISLTLDYLMFAFFPIIILWVVYSILKNKDIPQKTFDEYFYQDEEIKSNV